MNKPKITIVGVGLLGGSLALALKRKNKFRLVGWNHRASSRRKAAKILPMSRGLEEAVRGSDIILLCSHSSSIGPFLSLMRPWLGKGTLVMDVSSVKGEVVRAASRTRGMNRHFVPCHPMAGKEVSGPASADPSLYLGRSVFLTPLPGTPSSLVGRAKRFWRSIGAKPSVLGALEHDRRVALTSHLPHLLAATLMELYGRHRRRSPSLGSAVGSGFRDFTRIAAGNPSMWSDIVGMNASSLKVFLGLFRRRLAALEKDLESGRAGKWRAFFERSRKERERL